MREDVPIECLKDLTLALVSEHLQKRGIIAGTLEASELGHVVAGGLDETRWRRIISITICTLRFWVAAAASS